MKGILRFKTVNIFPPRGSQNEFISKKKFFLIGPKKISYFAIEFRCFGFYVDIDTFFLPDGIDR